MVMDVLVNCPVPFSPSSAIWSGTADTVTNAVPERAVTSFASRMVANAVVPGMAVLLLVRRTPTETGGVAEAALVATV